MRDKKVLRILPGLWMGVIFCFSHQPGAESSRVSGWVTSILETVAGILNLDVTGRNLNLLVRKGAHFTIFAVLGFLLFIAVYSKKEKLIFSSAAAVIIGTAYGVFDELHQYFIPGRSCQIMDMVIDAVGVLLAVLLCSGYVAIKMYLQSD